MSPMEEMDFLLERINVLYKGNSKPSLKRLLEILESAQKEEAHITSSTRDAISSRLSERYVGASSPICSPQNVKLFDK